jgi:hypothetical protein
VLNGTSGKRVSGVGWQHGTKLEIKPASGRSLPKTSAWVSGDRERGLIESKFQARSGRPACCLRYNCMYVVRAREDGGLRVKFLIGKHDSELTCQHLSLRLFSSFYISYRGFCAATWPPGAPRDPGSPLQALWVGGDRTWPPCPRSGRSRSGSRSTHFGAQSAVGRAKKGVDQDRRTIHDWPHQRVQRRW